MSFHQGPCPAGCPSGLMHHNKAEGCTHCACAYGRHGISLAEDTARCCRDDGHGELCEFSGIYDGACYRHADPEQVRVESSEFRRQRAKQARQRAKQVQQEARQRAVRRRMYRARALKTSAVVIPTLLLLGGWLFYRADQHERHEASCRTPRIEFEVADRAVQKVGLPMNGKQGAAAIETAYIQRRKLAERSAVIVTAHPDCFSKAVNNDAHTIQRLPMYPIVEMPHPIQCSDGWPSQSIGRRGACSHHGGIAPAVAYPIVRCGPFGWPEPDPDLSFLVLLEFGCITR